MKRLLYQILIFFFLQFQLPPTALAQNSGGYCYDTYQTPPNYEPPPNPDPAAPQPPPPVVPDLGNVRYYNVPAMVFNPGQEGAFVAAAVAAKDVISSTTPEQLVQQGNAKIAVLKGRLNERNKSQQIASYLTQITNATEQDHLLSKFKGEVQFTHRGDLLLRLHSFILPLSHFFTLGHSKRTRTLMHCGLRPNLITLAAAQQFRHSDIL